VRDQVIAADQVSSMDSLITRLLRVLHVLKDKNLAEEDEDDVAVEEEAVVEEVDVLNAPIARGWVTLKKIVTPYMTFLTKLHMYLNQKS